MKEAWQHNAQFGGFAEPLPALPPPVFESEDMSREQKPRRTTVLLSVIVTTPAGRTMTHRVSDTLPTEDYPLDKAISHLAARLGEQFPHEIKHGHD